MLQLVQLAGAVLILVAFIAAQAGRWSPQAPAYLVANLVGSVVLAVLAAVERQWGFLLLEGVWAAVSAWGVVRLPRGRAGGPPGA